MCFVLKLQNVRLATPHFDDRAPGEQCQGNQERECEKGSNRESHVTPDEVLLCPYGFHDFLATGLERQDLQHVEEVVLVDESRIEEYRSLHTTLIEC